MLLINIIIDYGVINQMEKVDFNKNKLNMLPILKDLSKLDLYKTEKGFEATSLYPSALWVENCVYL